VFKAMNRNKDLLNVQAQILCVKFCKSRSKLHGKNYTDIDMAMNVSVNSVLFSKLFKLSK